MGGANSRQAASQTNQISNTKADKEFRSNPQTNQLTATWFAHPKTYYTQAEGVEFQGLLRVGMRFSLQAGVRTSHTALVKCML